MKFVRQGPDIPERLLQAHEDGRVVFFCGAGVSYPAGLPNFAGLVKELYTALAPGPNPIQEAAIKAKHFDTAIGLLEADIVGGRETVRRVLAGILTPDLGAQNATSTHEALLTLGKSREGRSRIITTNFDRLFEEVIAAKSLPIERFQAPLLPVPKNCWDGLVYLHGLLSDAPTASELDRLVVSSGDFGLAYLTERWAARFVSELFRNYTVCFIGYSITDPVMRYMMDAHAADRRRGDSSPEMFAFGSYSKGKEVERANEWRAKNVTPILYREHNRHTYLHKTLRAWADTYRDGVRGKERIVVESALLDPRFSTEQDDFVARMLWALSDLKGLPAKRFAEMNPVPSLDWLEPLSEARYHHDDLTRFRVPPRTDKDDEISFSLIRRPSPSHLAPWMALTSYGSTFGDWDQVMQQLATWLIRHLDAPALIIWFAEQGGQIHPHLALRIEARLDELTKLERGDGASELARIRDNASMAIPRPLMRTLWSLLLAGRVGAPLERNDLYRWRRKLHRDGFGCGLHAALRAALTPRIKVSKPAYWPEELASGKRLERISDLAQWEIVLSAPHVHAAVVDLGNDVEWRLLLPELLPDFAALLKDALDLQKELGGIESMSDRSYVDQPSISHHPQNRRFHDWTALIELTRDAWLATATVTPERARHIAQHWSQTPYPLFRRLAFFAAAQPGVVPAQQGLDWLLADDCRWLWSMETQREAIRLMVALAVSGHSQVLAELDHAILDGPPAGYFSGGPEPDSLQRHIDWMVWLRLSKIDHAGAMLSGTAQLVLSTLSAKHPDLMLADDESDEFPFWMGESRGWREFTQTPRRRHELVGYLKTRPSIDHWYGDDWDTRCQKDFATTAATLCALAQQGEWPESRWRYAMQAWRDPKRAKRAWRRMAPVLARAPDDVLGSLANAAGDWLVAVAKIFDAHDSVFLDLCQRLLGLGYPEQEDRDDVAGEAINHPVGKATWALLDWWQRGTLEDEQRLPGMLKQSFTNLCDPRIGKFRYARVMLCARVIVLFRVDPDWSREHLLPLLDWQRSTSEARGAWQGFLWSPRLYRPLIEAVKPYLLDTAVHYSELGDVGLQYVRLLTFAALDTQDVLSTRELAVAMGALPPEGLGEAVKVVAESLDASAEQRRQYWRNRVEPFFRKIWPNSRDRISHEVAQAIAELLLVADDDFPKAMNLLGAWLEPLSSPGYMMGQLVQTELCRRFPNEALDFLARTVPEPEFWSISDLKACLDMIRENAPALATDHHFVRLEDYVRLRR
jgi:hypothetical protein